MNKYFIALLGLFSSPALAQVGQWEPFFPLGIPNSQTLPPIAPEHMIHVFDGQQGKVVLLGENAVEDDPTYCPGVVPPDYRSRSYLWTPPVGISVPGIFQDIRLCRTWATCSGHSALANGDIVVAGNAQFWLGYHDSNLFNPFAPVGPSMWNNPVTPGDTNYVRWYPTCTTLPDGRVLACSGLNQTGNYVAYPELFYPATSTWATLSLYRYQQLYPYMFVLPDGNIVDAGPEDGPEGNEYWDARILIHSTSPQETWAWGLRPLAHPSWPIDPPPTPPGEYGSAVTFAPGKVMKCGGGWPPPPPPAQEPPPAFYGLTTTFTVDLSNNPDPNNPPGWIAANPMNHPRMNHNLVILPDGKVLAVGGNRAYVPLQNPQGQWYHAPADPVFEAEIFDPASGNWAVQPQMAIPRMYHSTALLLRDGRVVVAGGTGFPSAQIFKPPYITIGAPRPVITSAPAFMHYGQQYTITYTGPDASVACLMRLATVTHAFDQSQRRVPLSISAEGDNTLTVVAPPNGNIAPPGYYMLFILNEYMSNQFAPCQLAAYVRVGPQ